MGLSILSTEREGSTFSNGYEQDPPREVGVPMDKVIRNARSRNPEGTCDAVRAHGAQSAPPNELGRVVAMVTDNAGKRRASIATELPPDAEPAW
jgi:hypothetical protein